MLELLRLPIPKDDLSGQSLVPDIFHDKQPAPRDILIDMPAGPYNESRRAFIHGDLKLIISRDTHKELYDLAADPEESRNVWGEKHTEIEAPYAVFKKRLKEIEVTGEYK